MLRMNVEAPRGLRWGLLALVAVMAATTVMTDPADARTRRKRGGGGGGSGYHPAYAAIVVDANNGGILHSSNPDALRHPASLTKIMTLFMLFERLESGRLKLDSPLQVSEHAADQEPTKLGLRAGSTITAEEAIKGMVTRSANDAAVVVGEAIGGSETEFAKMMTDKAHAIGMSRTIYRNASGLPDGDQVTTARDQATLGRAIQERFPRYYRYFSTRSFAFRGQSIGNHNRLLGRVEGVDGIKTGYTRASGFNLVTSVHRNNRYLVAVVLGGASGGSRDARMRELIAEHIQTASVQRTAPLVAERAPRTEEPRVAALAGPIARAAAAPRSAPGAIPGFALASATSLPVSPDTLPAVVGRPAAPGSTDPIRPVMVRTLNVKPGEGRPADARPSEPVRTASIVPFSLPTLRRAAEPPAEIAAPPAARVEAAPRPAARSGILGFLSLRAAEPPPAKEPEPIVVAAAAPIVSEPPRMAPAARPVIPVAMPAMVSPPIVAPAYAPVAPAAPRTTTHSGWMIQVGALGSEGEARARLNSVKSKGGRALAEAEPFTEATVKGGSTLYRARFAGFDRDQAEAACRYLKRNDLECMPVKN